MSSLNSHSGNGYVTCSRCQQWLSMDTRHICLDGRTHKSLTEFVAESFDDPPATVHVLLRANGTIAGVARFPFEPPRNEPDWQVVAYDRREAVS